MNNKKLLTLSDLCEFYDKKGEDVIFNAKNDGTNIVVQVNGKLAFDNDNDDDTSISDNLVPVHLQACHTGKNENSSQISDEVMTNALDTFKNKPILGYIYKDDNGEYEFAGHERHVELNDRGEKEVEYDEQIIGIVPESCNAQLVYDKDKGKNYVEVDGYLYNVYSHAVDILERKANENETVNCSVEMDLRSFSFNAKSHLITIEDFVFNGVTILGYDIDTGNKIDPGMDGANITLSDFSKDNNSIVEQIKTLTETVNQFSKQLDEMKGEKIAVKFKELCEKYNVAETDVTFEHDGLTDEELEAKFVETFGKNNDDDNSSDGNNDGEPTSDNDEGATEPTTDGIDDGTNVGDGVTQTNSKNGEPKTTTITYARNGVEFEVSLNDKLWALDDLVNNTYHSLDDTWYSTQVYDDYLVMVGWTDDGTVAYRQGYTESDGKYELVGDRVAVHPLYVTDAEEKLINDNKTALENAESTIADYQKKEDEAKKSAILSNADYSAISETDNFKGLVNDHENFSVDEVKEKADKMLFEYLKKNASEFSKKNDGSAKKSTLGFGVKPENHSRYGNLFAKKDK